MDDIISLIVVILIFVISTAGNKKNRDKKRQRKLERQQRRAAANRPAQAASAAQATARKPEPRVEQAQPAAQIEADCARRPVHLHRVSPQAMEAAGEGEDPCHPGSRTALDQEDSCGDSIGLMGVRDDPAQELLRGIVVSEILTRPCERMALQRNRRRA